MKTLLIVITMLLSFNVIASEDYCKSLSQIATGVMKLRQIGHDASDLIAVINRLAKTESERKLYKNLIIEAYETPRFTTDSVRGKVIEDFRDSYYVECMKEVLNRS